MTLINEWNCLQTLDKNLKPHPSQLLLLYLKHVCFHRFKLIFVLKHPSQTAQLLKQGRKRSHEKHFACIINPMGNYFVNGSYIALMSMFIILYRKMSLLIALSIYIPCRLMLQPSIHFMRNTDTPAHLCSYPISQSHGSSTVHEIMQLQVKSFS